MSRLYIWLFDTPSIRHIVHPAHLSTVLEKTGEPTLAADAHRRLISILEEHPTVRRISLPTQLRSDSASARDSAASTRVRHRFSLPAEGAEYPIVGLIDGGLNALPDAWVKHSSTFVAPAHTDQSHGTEIGSLLVDGQSINGPTVCPEPDGCWIADLAIIPREDKYYTYYPSDLHLITQIELEVQDAKAAVGARIFSFSHNIEEPPGGSPVYTELSNGLDRIARENDVIFVVSAGNATAAAVGRARREWAADKIAVLTNLASCSGDRITAPADSVLNISVGAVNPPDVPGAIAGAPARYSRRGPGFMQLVKPDVAHYGGVCDSTSTHSGLSTVGENGQLQSVFGTSFSAPLVAKALARYDLLTQGALPREALVALLIHGAQAPSCLDEFDKGDIVRNFVGFGLPTATDTMVAGSQHSATLLFHDRMMPKKDLFFGFDWPKSLVTDGKCRGHAVLTLVYAPPISDAFQTELVRVNLDASLQRMDPKTGRFKAQCVDTFSDGTTSTGAREKELIEDGLKWGVVKQSQFTSPRGSGKTSDWRIALKYLLRSDEVFPEEGIPFAMILTITDPASVQPVYQDMKLTLTARGVFTGDIRQPSGRIQSRGGRA